MSDSIGSGSEDDPIGLSPVNVSADPPMSFAGGDGAAGGAGGGGGASASDGTGASATAAANAPPGTVPAVTLTITPAANMQLARQEAAALGTLTGIALNKAGVPAGYATFVGAQVAASLTSPEGLDALMNGNQAVANALAHVGEANAAAPFGLNVSDTAGSFPVQALDGFQGPGG